MGLDERYDLKTFRAVKGCQNITYTARQLAEAIFEHTWQFARGPFLQTELHNLLVPRNRLVKKTGSPSLAAAHHPGCRLATWALPLLPRATCRPAASVCSEPDPEGKQNMDVGPTLKALGCGKVYREAQL